MDTSGSVEQDLRGASDSAEEFIMLSASAIIMLNAVMQVRFWQVRVSDITEQVQWDPVNARNKEGRDPATLYIMMHIIKVKNKIPCV